MSPASLQIVDVGNPFAPHVIALLDLPGSVAPDVVVVDDLVLVATDAAGLSAVDVSDPFNPQRIIFDRKLGLDRAIGILQKCVQQVGELLRWFLGDFEQCTIAQYLEGRAIDLARSFLAHEEELSKNRQRFRVELSRTFDA